MTHIDLFSGIGGFSLAASWVWPDHEVVCFCEMDPFCKKILNKHWPGVPIVEDVRELCETQNKKKQTQETLNSQNNQKQKEGSAKPANIVQQLSLFHQVSETGRIKNGDSALGNAEINSCEEITPQTQEVGNGCEGKVIQTGKTERVEIGQNDGGIKRQSKVNGEDGCSQGINIPAKNAEQNHLNTTSLERTTSKRGQSAKKKDSTSKTGSHSVNDAMIKSILAREVQIDILTAGVPCQPASVAGKQRGTSDDRWLWGETFDVVRKVRPRWCIFENVRGLISLEGGVVFKSLLSELEAIGYEVWSFIIPACSKNAVHRRDRVWIVAHTGQREQGECGVTDKMFDERNSEERPADTACGSGCESKDVANAGLRGFGKPENESKQQGRTNAVGSSQNVGHTGLQRQAEHEEQTTGVEQSGESSDVAHDGEQTIREKSRGIPESENPKQEPGWRRVRSSGQDVSHPSDKGLERWERDGGSGGRCSQEGEQNNGNEMGCRSGRSSGSDIEPERQSQRQLGGTPDGLSARIHNPWGEGWEDGTPRVITGQKDRVNRLKALGNSIVPQVVYEIMMSIKEVDEKPSRDAERA